MIDTISKKLKTYKRIKRDNSSLKKAAVLLPFFNKDDDLYLLFTKRTEKVNLHKGQFSFPGGGYDKTDKNLKETALRECEEEIGIVRDKIKVMGCLEDLETVTDYLVTPYVGILNGERNYKINSFEIERMLEVPFSYLFDESNWSIEHYTHNGKIYNAEFCIYKRDKIWGVTGRILKRLVDILKS